MIALPDLCIFHYKCFFYVPVSYYYTRQIYNKIVVTQTKTVKEIAEDRLAAPANFDHGSNCGSVRIRFNHYNSAFPIHNGVLKWESVDDKYSISFVYRGNYVRNLEYTSDTIPSNQRSSPNDIETRYAARDDMVRILTLISINLLVVMDLKTLSRLGINRSWNYNFYTLLCMQYVQIMPF